MAQLLAAALALLHLFAVRLTPLTKSTFKSSMMMRYFHRLGAHLVLRTSSATAN